MENTRIPIFLITGSNSYDNACVDTPVIEEGLVCGLLQGLNPHIFMDLDGLHPKVLKAMTEIIVATS